MYATILVIKWIQLKQLIKSNIERGVHTALYLVRIAKETTWRFTMTGIVIAIAAISTFHHHLSNVYASKLKRRVERGL
jgi:energy-converting hydrogenase Eha subunit B